MLTRRQLMLSSSGLVAAACASAAPTGSVAAFGQPEPEPVSEDQRGDPDSPEESVSYDAGEIRRINTRVDGQRALFEAWVPDLPQRLLTKAFEFEGINRQNNPQRITEFLALFGVGFRNQGGQFEAFCAAGISYCAIAAYTTAIDRATTPENRKATYRSLAADIDHYYFYPTVSCQDMWNIAKGRRLWVPSSPAAKATPKAGWVVLFDWSGKGLPNHCGLVTKADQTTVHTIEFNTSAADNRNGGAVAARDRNYANVMGFIRTDRKPGA